MNQNTQRIKMMRLSGFFSIIQALVLICSIAEVKGHTGTLRGLAPSYDGPCIAVVADFESFEGSNDEYALFCQTSRLLYYEVLGVPADWIMEKISSGELKSGITELHFPDGSAILNDQHQIETESLPLLAQGEIIRKLDGDSDIRTVLVVRAVGSGSLTNNFSEEDYIQSVFGNNVNLQTQMNACSHGKLQIIPTDFPDERITTGVATVTVSTNPQTATTKEFEIAVLLKLYEMFDVDILTDLADFVMLCFPDRTINGPAYAYLNTGLSAYNDKWCTRVSTQMHEIGHNLNLAHASDVKDIDPANTQYDDQVGYMGYSYANSNIQMCYNPAKTYQLGWFDDKTIVCEPTPCEPCYLEFGGFVDYDKSDVNTVLVKVNQISSTSDYYMTYNAATGFNSDTLEGQNTVVINEQGKEGLDDDFSFLEATLSAGESYTIEGFADVPGGEVIVSVESIVNGIATVKVYVAGYADGCPSDNPSGVPSHVPSGIQSHVPSTFPSDIPSDVPSSAPSSMPSDVPTFVSSDTPSTVPSNFPSKIESDVPSETPSIVPSDFPSDEPSDIPSKAPSAIPTLVPSEAPSDVPSNIPSIGPSEARSDVPSTVPSEVPSDAPTDPPSIAASDTPSDIPSDVPSTSPSGFPSEILSDAPSDIPSVAPTSTPSDVPSETSSNIPSDIPSEVPSKLPTGRPSDLPSNVPSQEVVPS